MSVPSAPSVPSVPSVSVGAFVGGVPLERTRIRRFTPHLGRAGETFGGREGKSLKALGFGRAAVMLIECLGDGPGEKFDEFNPNEMVRGFRVRVGVGVRVRGKG